MANLWKKRILALDLPRDDYLQALVASAWEKFAASFCSDFYLRYLLIFISFNGGFLFLLIHIYKVAI